jgi:hypothetical protein
MSLGVDYIEFAQEFEVKKKGLEVEFCKGMFELYYSDKGLTEERVGELGEMLVEIHKRKNVAKEMSEVPGFWAKIRRVFEEKKKKVTEKVGKYRSTQDEKEKRKARILDLKERESSNWVKKAIRMKYDKRNVSRLLKSGKRSGKEIKNILKMYDKQIMKMTKDKRVVRSDGGEGGIAQRIIEKEKDRLEGAEAPGV